MTAAPSATTEQRSRLSASRMPAQAPATTSPSRVRTRARSLLTDWLPALPLLLFATAMLVLPALTLLHDAFALRGGGYGLANAREVVYNPVDRAAISNSLALAGLQASVATLLGAPAAYLMSRMNLRGRASWIALMTVASNFAGIGLAFAFVALIGTTGLLTLVLQNAFGMTNPFPPLGSFSGVNLVYLYFNIPLFVLLTLPAMSVLRADWWEAAQVSQASRWQFWRYVGLPVLGPFVIGGWILIFTWTVGVYAVAFAVASSPDSVRLLTLQIGSTLESSVFGLERAAVLSVFLMVLAVLAMSVYRLVLGRAARWL